MQNPNKWAVTVPSCLLKKTLFSFLEKLTFKDHWKYWRWYAEYYRWFQKGC